MLRPYQKKIIDDVYVNFTHGKLSPLIVLPTSGGKTVCFAQLAKQFSDEKKTVWILVHRIELKNQAEDKLKLVGVEQNVEVWSVQTLVRRLKSVTPPDLIIIDECHHGVSNTYKKIYDSFPFAKRVGVTATPVRADGRGLGSVHDNFILGPSLKELIRDGYISDFKIFAPPIRLDLSGIKTIGGDYNKQELDQRVNKDYITGDIVGHYAKIAHGKKCLTFCVSVEHAKTVANAYNLAGFRARSIDGSVSPEERTQTLKMLSTGEIQILTSCDLIGEGLDVPSVEVVQLCRPTKSLSLYLQQVGRGLRKHHDKPYTIILDHVGNVKKHGWPDDDREWSLDDRKKIKSNDDSINIRQCDRCYSVFEGRECPECGHVNASIVKREIELRNGELEELKRSENKSKTRKDFYREAFKCKTSSEVIQLAVKYGYKPYYGVHAWNYILKNRRY